MSSQNLARIAIFGLFLTQILEGNGQIFYPNAASVNDFHVGDTLNVSLANPYGLASLLLYCNNETTPRQNETVPSSSTTPILLTLDAPANPSCYLKITQDPNSYLTSVTFSVSPSNGTVKNWSLDSQSEGQLPPAGGSAGTSRLATTRLSFDLAAPVTPRPPITLPDDGLESTYILADGTNCLIVTASSSLHQGCWDALGLDQWLPQWFNETPKCAQGSSSDTNCQSQDPVPEAWTSTFLREYGIANDDCLHLDSVVFSCQDIHQAPFTPDESPLLTARFEYVKSNIVAIARYFSAWHLALVDAASAANDAIKPIINLIDDQKKPKSNRLAVNIFLAVLGLGLSFIPIIGPEVGIAEAGLKVADAAIEGVKAASDLSEKLWPTGGDNTVEFQVDALTDLFTNGLLPSLETNFEDLLSTIQGFGQPDPSAFLGFAGGGEFSVPTVQGPAAGAASDVQKTILKQSMTTFLVSTALSQNGWQALLVPGVDAEGLFNGNKACPDWASSQCNDDKDAIGCRGHYSSGQCFDTYWWYSVEQNSMYTLLHNGKLDRDATGKLGQIFNQGWSTGPLLFENAVKCEFQNLLQTAQPQTYTYTPNLSFGNQGAGFTYSSLIAGLNASYQLPVTVPTGTTIYFLPIAGSGFVELSKLPSVHDAQYHPISEPFAIQPTGGLDESCVSNLNVTIATSWGGKHNWQ